MQIPLAPAVPSVEPAVAETPRTVAVRRTGLDAARIIAALGTVWTHARADIEYNTPSAIGRFAVPFFSMVAGIYLVHAMRSTTLSGIPTYLRNRAAKLYLPFIAWSFIFIAIRYAASLVVPIKDAPTLEWWLPLTGSMYHLWFLPFLLLATLILTPLVRLALRTPQRSQLVAVLLIAAGVALVRFPAHIQFTGVCDHMYFLDRAWARSPALLWGVALGLLITTNPKDWRIPRSAALLGFAVTAFCMGYYWEHGRTSWAANLAGAGWLVVGLAMDGTAVARYLAPAGRMSFGVYLIHPLIVAMAYKVMTVQHVKDGPLAVFCVFVIAAAVSLGATAMIRARKQLAWLIP